MVRNSAGIGMNDKKKSDFFRADLAHDLSQIRSPFAFEPWHKPRKQWVREKQWGNGIKNFVERYLDLSERPLTYLTLPGEDFLDVRHLQKIAVDVGFELDFQGFVTERSANHELSLSEIRDLQNICVESDIIPYKFETISKKKSLGREAATRPLGFDVVNLDFCNSVGALEAGTQGSAIDAIVSLIELQSLQRLEPWMLFVTSKCDPKSVSQSVRSSLAKVFHQNCSAGEFEQKVSEKLALTTSIADQIGAAEAKTEQIEQIDAAANFNFFGLGFTKWLISIAFANWEVAPGNLAGYRVYNNDLGCDMFSSVYYFKRMTPPHIDKSGLSTKKTIIPRAAETELAIKAIGKIESFTDVDKYLNENSEEHEQLIVSNANLLAEARFDHDKAKEWGESVAWRPSSEIEIT